MFLREDGIIMPRILQLSPRLPYPLDDGGRIATWNLSRCLHHNGYELDLIGFARDEAAIAAASEPLSQVFKSVSPVLKNVERQYPATLLRALLTGSSYFTRKYYSSRVAELIRQHVARGRYDATLIDSAYMGVYLPVLRRCGAAVGKIVLREHNVEYELLERLAVGDSNPFYRAVLRREAKLFRRYELELVRQVNDVRMISPRDAEVLAAAGVQPAPAVLAPFVDMDRYHCGRAEQVEPESLVCVGNMAWPPNTNGVQWFCEHV
ncbi:MAG: glycosyltransferase, partial [bacterium]|nr:glycosyltransferase [bacterium]